MLGTKDVLAAACLVLFYPYAEGAAIAADTSGYAMIKDFFLVALRPLNGVPAWMQPDPGPLTRHGTCECHNNTCGCCALFVVQQFQFQQQGCLNISYNATEYAGTVNLLLGNYSIFEASLSGRNPPPLCIPVPQLPIISICIKLYDIHTEGDNWFTCLDLELRLQGISIFVVSFDCLKFGPDGLALIKPKPKMKPLLFPLLSVNLSKPEGKKTKNKGVLEIDIKNSTISKTKNVDDSANQNATETKNLDDSAGLNQSVTLATT